MVLIDPEFIKWFSTLGVGGILAGMMFFWYRKDVTQKAKDCEKREDQLVDVIRSNSASHEKLSLSIQNLSTSIKEVENSKLQQLQILIETALKKGNNG